MPATKLEIANAEFEKLKATQQSEIEDLESDLEIYAYPGDSRIQFRPSIFMSRSKRKRSILNLKQRILRLHVQKNRLKTRKRFQQAEIHQKA